MKSHRRSVKLYPRADTVKLSPSLTGSVVSFMTSNRHQGCLMKGERCCILHKTIYHSYACFAGENAEAAGDDAAARGTQE